jgi:hypothetical protein
MDKSWFRADSGSFKTKLPELLTPEIGIQEISAYILDN